MSKLLVDLGLVFDLVLWSELCVDLFLNQLQIFVQLYFLQGCFSCPKCSYRARRVLEHNIRQEGIGDRVAWGESCYEELEKERGQGEETSSWKGARMWCANFLIRRGQTRYFLVEWFDCESIPSGRRRRMMQLVLGNFPCGA